MAANGFENILRSSRPTPNRKLRRYIEHGKLADSNSVTMMNDNKPRIQFGIRTLFVLLLMASIPLAWVAFDIDKSRQRNAIEREWATRGARVGFAADRRVIV